MLLRLLVPFLADAGTTTDAASDDDDNPWTRRGDAWRP